MRFTLPRDLYHGKGSLEELKNLKGTRAFVVTGGGSMKRFGFLQRVENALKEAGMEVHIFEGVEPDPSVTTVMRGAEEMRQFQATNQRLTSLLLRVGRLAALLNPLTYVVVNLAAVAG